MLLTGEVEHLPLRRKNTAQDNALHIHATRDCAAPGATSAGGLFNPAHKQHSYPGAGMAGGLPMLAPDAQGAARIHYLSSQVKLESPSSVMGKAVIVHRNVDDWAIQPDGRAGPAIACAVIEAVAPEKKSARVKRAARRTSIPFRTRSRLAALGGARLLVQKKNLTPNEATDGAGKVPPKLFVTN